MYVLYVAGWTCLGFWFALVALRAIHLHLDIVRATPAGYIAKWWVVPWACRGHAMGMLVLLTILIAANQL